MNKKNALTSLMVVLTTAIVVVIFLGSQKSSDNNKYKDKHMIITQFNSNISYFSLTVEDLKDDKSGIFAFRGGMGKIYIKDGQYNEITVEKDIHNSISYILKELNYQSIQSQPYCIIYKIYDDERFEQEIIYIKDEALLKEDWFYNEDTLEKIKDNWYYHETKHEHV